jgi:hypothetical protein
VHDEIPARPPTLDEAGPPTEAPAVAAAPPPAAATNDVRKWVGAAIGIVAIAVAALVGTGVISSSASTGDRGGPGGFRGTGGPPGFTRGGPGGFPGGGRQFGGGGGFPGQQQVPSTPSTSVPNAVTS